MVPSLFLTSSHLSFPLPIFPRLLIESPSIALFTKLFFRCFASISSFYGERAETHLSACTPTPTYTYMHMQASYLASTCTVLRQRLLPYNTHTRTDARVLSPHARVSPYVFVRVCTWSSSLRHKHRLYRFGCLCTLLWIVSFRQVTS